MRMIISNKWSYPNGEMLIRVTSIIIKNLVGIIRLMILFDLQGYSEFPDSKRYIDASDRPFQNNCEFWANGVTKTILAILMCNYNLLTSHDVKTRYSFLNASTRWVEWATFVNSDSRYKSFPYRCFRQARARITKF